MPINASGAAGAPLTVYGSWVTDVSPDSLPEGVSPDNQEVVFAPGDVGSRPAFQKITGITFPAVNGVIPTAVYGKSFKTPTGEIKNLYLDSAGRLFVEDLTNNPGVPVLLLQSTPGSYCRSMTKFGREYIAISDGLHGSEIPLQYDGTYLDRVTQCGPGGAPKVVSVALASSKLASSGNALTRINNQVLASTATAHNMKVGYQAQISNVPDSNSTSVNQLKTSPAGSSGQTTYSGWSYVEGQWRSNFNPGTSPLSGFVATKFGFNIPSVATILGAVVTFGARSQGSTANSTVAEVALYYEGALEGTLKSPATPITTAYTTTSYGSSADLWGAALTPSIVNDSTFGFAVSCYSDGTRLFLFPPFELTIYYTLSGSGTVAIVSSIVINNETESGMALVTTTQPHGLIPGIDVSIVGVEPGLVSAVTSAQWESGTTTLTTTSSHNLTVGSVIQNSGITTSTSDTSFSFDGTFTVEKIPSPNQVSYVQTPITATDPDVINATSNTGNIYVSWPIPDNTPTPTYFEIDSCPTETTFYVAVTYGDGTWTSGTVGFAWEGTFYVTEVVDPTHFYYYQPGPSGATTAIGTVTPFGQAGPGLHLLQVLFKTRNSAITKPGPFITFIANGGQYVSVTDIPIGPPDTISRILAFTGAQPDVPGEIPPFYYIPVPAQLEGQVISTSTVINDNTTTTAFLDFSDNTLYAAIGISIMGNNLANQIVLDGALGFSTYLSRLQTWGQRNCIQNLLNLGFEGGYSSSSPNVPLGWSTTGGISSNGSLVDAPGGIALQVTLETDVVSTLWQPGYLDVYGEPIFVGNQTYSVRFKAKTNGAAYTDAPYINFHIQSASTSFTSTATVHIGNSTDWKWFEADLSLALPNDVPEDLEFVIEFGGSSASSITPLIVSLDEINVIFSETPYLDQNALDSYANNPEGIDGDTGPWGAIDTAKLMDMTVNRGTLYLLTQSPTGKLHSTNGSTVTEPSGWEVEPIQGQCGALSAFTLITSQADDATQAGGDDWFAWGSDTGAMICGGGKVEKISQEIQPNWNDPIKEDKTVQINMSAALTAWGLNDPVARLLMFGLPIGTATAPNQIYVLNYQHLGSADTIANSPPFHPSFAGKLIATDNARKWTHWLRPMNGAARMYRAAGQLTNCFFGGNGQSLGSSAGYGNVYTLNPAKFTDDDFGQIYPYYVTYFFLEPEKAEQLQLKAGRLLLAFVMAMIQPMPGDTNSQVTLTYYPNDMATPWPLSTTRVLTPNYYGHRNFGGGMASGDHIAIKISSSPVSGTDNSFILTKLEAAFRNARILISGVNK